MGSVSAHKGFIHCGHRCAVYRRKYRMDDPPQTNNRVIAASMARSISLWTCSQTVARTLD
jgi:hypothetical protein